MEFRYQAVDAQGRPSSGKIDAADEAAAVRILAQTGLTPTEMTGMDAVSGRGQRGTRTNRTSAQEKALFVQELATLLQAGIALAEAIESLGSGRAGSQLGKASARMHGRLRAGDSLAAALKNCGIEWPVYLHQLVAAGEQTGKLAQALHSAAAQMEYEERVGQEMRNALIYPAILVLSGIAATLMVFLVVVPKFSGLLKSTRAEIPAVSVWVLKTGLFVNENLLLVGLLAVALAFALAFILRDAALRARLLQRISTLPLIGAWLVETEVARWASMLGTLLENRVPILGSMELAEMTLRLDTMRHGLQRAQREVKAGKKLADALDGVGMLDATALNLIRVGERSGNLAGMLRTLAGLYENAGRQRLKRFLILIEPAAILIIGGVIGFIMVAIMLAITSLSNISI